MSRLLLTLVPPTLLALAACDTIERNPCDRYADFVCDCFGADSADCREVTLLADDPTADVQDACEVDLASAQQDTAECLTPDTDSGLTTAYDTATW